MNTDRLNNDMFGRRPNHVGLLLVAVLLVLLAIVMVGVSNAYAMEGEKFPTGWLVANDGITAVCDIELNPAQDSTFPPEGYHCRPLGENGTIDTESSRKEQDKPITSTETVTQDNPAVVVPNDVPADDNPPANDDKPKGNNGNHYGNDKPDNNPKDNSPFNGDDSRDDFDETREERKNEKKDNGSSSLPIATAGFIFVTFKKGRKEYFATVSSWHYSGKNLWLYIHGENGNCGYVPNGKVIATSETERNPGMTEETTKVIQLWDM